MRFADIESHRDQLCDQLSQATDPLTVRLTRDIINSLHEYIWGHELTKDDYTWLFMHVAALGHKFAQRLQGNTQDVLDEEYMRVLQSKLTGSH
jgi:hypothetical protein